MGKTVYVDCFSGVSGDMMLGALLDLGLPLGALREALGSLAIDYGEVTAERVRRAGVAATKFRLVEHAARRAHESGDHDHDHRGHAHHDHDEPPVRAPHVHHHHDHDPHPGRAHHSHPHDQSPASAAGGGSHLAAGPSHAHHSLADIGRSIDRSALSPDGKARARELFRRLAEAEAAIHDMPLERIHLHEVGAVDSIIDIVGAVFGMEWLGATEVVASPLNVGSGTVRCAHGVFPVPAPATARLLTGVPIYAGGVARELTTPTGALLVTSYAGAFGPLPAMAVSAVGYGAGDADFPQHPNVLRLMVGERTGSGATERIVSVECEIDDMNPQLFGPLMDRLHAAGALDVFYAPVQMKKNRPGVLVTVLVPPDRREPVTSLLFAETTTIGVRYVEMQRERLERESRTVETPLGPVRVKVARRGGAIVNAAPEFDDCARIAAERSLPLKTVQALAARAWLDTAEQLARHS